MERFTAGSIARGIFSAITIINMILVAFGGQEITVADNIVYTVASIVAVVVAGFLAWYKNNSTSRFGILCKTIKNYVNEHGIEQVFETIVNALEENFGDGETEETDK